MKCGSCLVSNASLYTKVTEGHNLFEILKKLNPARIYNIKHSYFCGSCVEIATKKLTDKEFVLSDQNANSLSVNSSFTTNTTVTSIDEYDLLVPSQIVLSDTGSMHRIRPNRDRIDAELKRKSAPESTSRPKDKPCPKRFKKRKPDDANLSISENPNPESTVGQVHSSHSSEISENDVLLHIEPENTDTESSVSSGNIATSRRSVRNSRTAAGLIPSNSDSSWSSVPHETATNATNVKERAAEVRNRIVSSRNPNIVSASSQQLPITQQAIAGPSAPIVKNPRIRQENIRLQRNTLRRYYEQNEQEVNVNNYSRTTAG